MRTNQVKKNSKTTDMGFKIVTYTIFIILALIFAYPFYYLFICTISDNNLVNLNKIIFYPIRVHFGNYIDVLSLERFRSAAVVSVARTVVGTSFSVAITAYAGYIFSKQEMWHRKLFYRFLISTMYFGAGLIPNYMNIKMLGLMNTFWVYIIPGAMSVYNMILVKTSIEALPGSLEESAEIDGAGYMTRFLRIVLPLNKPILATIALFEAVGHWNNMFTTKMYITNQKLFTLQYVLHEYYQQVKSIQETLEEMGGSASEYAAAVSSTSIRLTMTVVTMIPVLCIYPFVQKYYLKGIMIGAVKG